MGFRFVSLGSGSRGNATLVEAGATRVLVDCGFAARELVERCASLGFDPAALDAILVTHEHGDHVRGVGALARRFDIPVWTTHGTWRAADCGAVPRLSLFAGHAGDLRIGELDVTVVPVPHDAREPVQFCFAHRARRCGVLTDLGSVTPAVLQAFDGVDALLLECNHDPGMLAAGPYPPSVQARVGGRYGHLANGQAAELLRRVDRTRLQHLVAGHLIEQNNSPALVRETLLAAVPDIGRCLDLLIQDRPSAWFDIVT
jgi:phosphoribosyl 1,2-cyclic phosphodiesterase